MSSTAKITKWGNSCGIRIPAIVLKKADLAMNDQVYIEADRKGRIVIKKQPGQKRGTIQYLFKDYSGERFGTELVDIGEPVGEERW